MSIESNIGRRVYELRDVVKSTVLENILEYINSENIVLHPSGEIHREHLLQIQRRVNNCIDIVTENGIKNVLSAVKEK